MTRVGVVSHGDFRKHETLNHPEQPARLDHIEARLQKTGLWDQLIHIEPVAAIREDLLRVHDVSLVNLIESTAGKGPGYLDADTIFGPESGKVAALAAGAVMSAARAVLAGQVDHAMALVRPPGHHATRKTPMGFCLYNNVAVAARYLQHHYEIERVAILDFDVHHGNGTQDIFYEDPSVFYLSMHQLNIFPATGRPGEEGAGEAVGTTLNLPLDPKMSNQDIRTLWRSGLDKVQDWRPQFILVSAGFDGHELDPLASMAMQTADYYRITRDIMDMSRRVSAMGVVSALEGGYNLVALSESVEVHVKAMLEG